MNHKRPSYDGILTKALDPLVFKLDAAAGILSGYMTKWWVVDSYGEFTVPGSTAKTIAERGPQGANRIVLRYEHEYTVGVFTSAVEDATGLYIEAQISDDGMYGSMLRSQLADGVPYGLSIGFRRVSQRAALPDDPLDLSTAPKWILETAVNDSSFLVGLTEIKLMEGSAVTFPAVDPAMVDGYRAAEDLNSRALTRMMTDLKSGKLTHEHLTQLKALVAALPADAAPDPAQVAAAPRDARTADPTASARFVLAYAATVAARHGIAMEQHA